MASFGGSGSSKPSPYSMASGGVNGSFKPETEEKEKEKEKEKEEEEGVSLGTAMAAVGAAALAAWGIYKWFGSSDPEPEQKVKMMKKPGRDGYMPRPDFEDSPKDYFRDLRRKN